MGRLAGKVAVISGGANGIGRDTALRFLSEGARVVIGDINQNNAEHVLNEAGEAGYGASIRFIKADVSQEADVNAMVVLATSAFGRIDCVFNNAGIGGVYGPISDTPVNDWDYTVAVLLRSVFLGMKHGARALKAQGEGGVIMSTSSVAGFAAGAGAHCYSAAKAAINNLTRSVAVELAEHRIRVNAIAPGPVMTDLFHRGDEAAATDQILKRQPWPEPGDGRDVAAVALFLACDDSRFVTGQTIVADGGLMAAGPALFDQGSQNVLFQKAGLDQGSINRRSTKTNV